VTLNSRACALRRSGVSREGAVAALWTDVCRWAVGDPSRPWTLADVEAKVARVWEDIEPSDNGMPVEPEAATLADTASSGVRAYTIGDARLRHRDSIEYLPVLGVDGFVIKGWSHLFAGWWRLGKTELMAAIVLPWLRTGHRILWISEEPDSVWADRAEMFDGIYEPVPWDNLKLVDALSWSPDELLAFAASFDSDIVIADTIREVCGIKSMKDDDAVHEAMGPWLRALRGRTSIFNAQHRKAAGEDGERVMGTVTLPSKMDVVLELEKVKDQERQRKLTARRRRRAIPPLIVAMDDDDRIVVIPDGRTRSRVETETVVAALVNASGSALTTLEVRKLMSNAPSVDTVGRALLAAAKRGEIDRDPPVGEDAERRTPKWLRRASAAGKLPQDLHTRKCEISAADDVAADSRLEHPETSLSDDIVWDAFG
jgi:hypothetical protein